MRSVVPLSSRVSENDARDEGMKWRRAREPDGDFPLLAARGAPGRRERMIDVGQDRTGIGEQRRAGVGQLDAARLAAKQLHIELPLQCANLLAERRLLHAEPFRRPRDVLYLGDGDEISKVPELHLPFPIDMNIAVII